MVGVRTRRTEAAAQARYTTVPIRISGEGNYRSVAAFFRRLRERCHDTGVTGFDLKSVDKGDTTESRFVFNLVWYAAPTAVKTKK